MKLLQIPSVFYFVKERFDRGPDLLDSCSHGLCILKHSVFDRRVDELVDLGCPGHDRVDQGSALIHSSIA